MRTTLCFFVLALAVGCSNGRGSCQFNSDCSSSMHCLNQHCVANVDAEVVDSGPNLIDAGHDAASVGIDAATLVDAAHLTDAGHDAAATIDGGSDAGHDGGHDAGAHDAFVSPTGSPLWFSEYIEGSGNNKALEIVNTGATSFTATACQIHLYANGASTMTASYSLIGSIPAGGVYTLCSSMATAFAPSSCTDAIAAGVIGFNGNDALELVCAGVTIDVIGQIGNDPGSAGWGTTLFTTNQTLRRQCTVTSGDPNGADAFSPETEWTGFPIDTVDGLGMYGCP